MLNPKIIQKLIPHMSIVNWPRTAKLLDDYSRTEHVPLNISSLLPLIKNEESSKFIPLLCLQLILLLSIGFWSFLNHHIFYWSTLIHSRHSTAQFSEGRQKWYFKIEILISINGLCPCIFLLSIFPTFLIFKINSENVYISWNLSL